MLSREGRRVSSAFLAMADGLWPTAESLHISCRILGLGLLWLKAPCPPSWPPRPAWAQVSLPGQDMQSQQQDKLPLLAQRLQLPCVLEGDRGMVQTRLDGLCPAHIPNMGQDWETQWCCP